MAAQIEAGKYHCRITRQALEEKERQVNGVVEYAPQFVLGFEVLGAVSEDDPEMMDEGPLEGIDNRNRTIWMIVTSNSAARTAAALKALGFEGDSEAFDPDHKNHVSLVGKTVVLECRHDTYQGVKREKWDVPLNGVLMGNPAGPVAKAALKSLLPRIGDAKPAAAKKPSGKSKASQASGEEVPF
jgi:hypothetical protein